MAPARRQTYRFPPVTYQHSGTHRPTGTTANKDKFLSTERGRCIKRMKLHRVSVLHKRVQCNKSEPCSSSHARIIIRPHIFHLHYVSPKYNALGRMESHLLFSLFSSPAYCRTPVFSYNRITYSFFSKLKKVFSAFLLFAVFFL